MRLNFKQNSILSRIDWWLLAIVVGIAGAGLVNLYSITRGSKAGSLFVSQSMWLGIGLGIVFIMGFFDADTYRRWVYFIYGFILALLVSVLLVGVQLHGSTRWLDFGFFFMQPSELLKIGAVLTTARFFHGANHDGPFSLVEILRPFAVLSVGLGLVVAQPDLGTTVVIVAIFGAMVFFEGLDLRSLFVVFIVALVALPLGWSYGLQDYQKERITTFLGFSRDKHDQSWQIRQSMIAIGSGRVWGKGYMESTQVKEGFVPEDESDFVAANWGEEHGFMGMVFLLSLYGLLILRCIYIARHAFDRFGMHLCIGVASMIFWHVTANLGMVSGLLPVVGLTLPLMSYGGSSFITFMIGIGLVHTVSMDSDR